jgi:hypothetical protein
MKTNAVVQTVHKYVTNLCHEVLLAACRSHHGCTRARTTSSESMPTSSSSLHDDGQAALLKAMA